MDLIDHILTKVTTLCSLCEDVRANKNERCVCLKDRVEGLKQVLRATKRKGGQISPKVHQALKELMLTLESAIAFIHRFTTHGESLIKRIKRNTFDHGDEFQRLTNCLNDAFRSLSLNLLVEVDSASQREADEAARKKEKMLDEVSDKQDTLAKTLEAISLKLDAKADVKQKNEMPILPPPVPQMAGISSNGMPMLVPEYLTIDSPKKLIMKTDIFEVLKGEYNKIPVAIKKYLCASAGTMPSEMIKEAKTMMRYESPHILQLLGLCYQGGNGLLVMEYCNKGSLREVLDNSELKLRWDRKARMCLDAAQGIYRLHQSDERSKLHGSISSDNFMVAEGYRVKLGGLELAQTETSLRRNRNLNQGSMRYRSPEQLESFNHPNCKICEIYSLGMVLWEIATRMKPLGDCTTDLNIHKRVCEDKRVLEPLPEDCPKKLGELINACRGYDPFQRPTVGVLVDKLREVVEQLEEE